IFSQADAIVCDVFAQCEVLGELQGAKEAGVITHQNQVVEMGNVILQNKSVRTSSRDVTVVDLTGTGVQDTKIALYANEKLMEKKLVDVPMSLVEKAEALSEQLIMWRRHLHAHPELSFMEKATSEYVASELAKLKNITIQQEVGGYGIVATLTSGVGPTIA